MTTLNCNCACRCTVYALIASVIIGVITAFLQITAVITITPVFLWVIFGIAILYLIALVIAASNDQAAEREGCRCSALNTLLIGILGTILFALILLAVGIVATSVISALLVGLLAFFFALMLSATACYARSLTNCG